MHRPKPSKWKNVWPFLAILVIVPALGWAAATALSRQQTTTVTPAPTSAATTPTSSPSPTEAPTQEPQSESEPTPSPSTSSPAAPDHGAVIQVLNGTGTQGYAGQKAAILNEAGYAGTSAANADGWATQTSTVFYEDPRMEATAKDVASKLGIDTVRQESGLGNPDIVVILR